MKPALAALLLGLTAWMLWRYVRQASTPEPVVLDEAVVVRGRSATFDPARMVIDRPYPYTLEGMRYIAVRRDDDSLDFYEAAA